MIRIMLAAGSLMMVLTGMEGIQAGRKPQEIVETARAAAEEQGAQLLAAGYPRP